MNNALNVPPHVPNPMESPNVIHSMAGIYNEEATQLRTLALHAERINQILAYLELLPEKISEFIDVEMDKHKTEIKAWVQTELNGVYSVVEELKTEISQFKTAVDTEITAIKDNHEKDISAANKRIDDAIVEFNKKLVDLDIKFTTAMLELDYKLRELIATQRAELVLIINKNYEETMAQINAFNRNLRDLIDFKIAQVIIEIKDFVSEGLFVRSPVTGRVVTTEKAMHELYDALRFDAMTVAEYELLGLTADEYIEYGLTADDYAVKGRKMLLARDGKVYSLLSGELLSYYDIYKELATLHNSAFTAEEYAEKGWTADEYELKGWTAEYYANDAKKDGN